MIVCWSIKGGSGTTVVSAALALSLAQRNNAPVRIVDLAGDIPSALGIAEPSSAGVSDWLVNETTEPLHGNACTAWLGDAKCRGDIACKINNAHGCVVALCKRQCKCCTDHRCSTATFY